MRKTILVAAIFLAGAAGFSGCGSTPKETGVQNYGPLAGAPAWVLSPEVDGALAAVGSARIGGAGMNFARTEAMAVARDELARQMSVKVNNMVKNFTETTGIGDAETVDKVATQVSKQVASETLVGSKQTETWISPENELYLLVVLDADTAQEAVKNATATSFKNDQALWQKFQAQKAQDELSEAVEKEFGDYKK